MKKFSLRNLAPLLFTMAIICLPLVGVATTHTPSVGFPPAPSLGTPPAPTSGGCTGASCTIENPLKNVTNFCDLIKIVLQAILIIGMPIAVVFLLIVGFKFILAQGNPEKIKEAQKNFLHTVIGIAVFLGAWAIAKIIAATLAGLGVSAVNECVR
jgi:hypothetical protein